MNNVSTVAVIGAGNRGARVYGNYIKNHQDKIRAVAIGHGGGDEGLMNHFVQFLQEPETPYNNPAYSTTMEDSLESHKMAFAAEKSRQEGKVISCLLE